MSSTPAAPVRWGFIGAGMVATKALAPAVHASTYAVLHAAAARDIDRAAALEPAATSSDDYHRVIADDEVDAVYISLTNDVHLDWILAALASGKHVLCEKPLTMNAAECEVAFEAARAANRLLVEAAWNQWHPRTRRLDELVGDGTLGRVRGVRAEFTFDGVPQGNYRLDASKGGGALLDVGPYLLRPAANWVDMNGVDAAWTIDAVDRRLNDVATDVRTKATLSGPDGASAHLLASFTDPEYQALSLTTESGSVTLDSPAFTSWRQACGLQFVESGRRWSESFAGCDAYEVMVSHVSRRILGDGDAFIVSEVDSLRCLRLMDRIDEAAQRP